MIGIIIKSFNRPYYLDRCIQSIYKNVEGQFTVTVLDDGTPEKYLDKIRIKHPSVKIKLSNQYPKKSKAIQENLKDGKEIDGFQIPTQLWKDAVNESFDYVLVTEDDVWFTDKINLEQIAEEMKANQIDLVKLGWLGNYKDDEFIETKEISQNLNSLIPLKLFTSNKLIMDLFMYNKYKFFTILYKLGWVDNKTKRKYWALNSILMGFYRKEYWEYIWKDAQGKVDEKQQLRNAAVWYHKYKKKENTIARTKSEVMKTTFKSSATNSYHKYGFDFDVNYFNHLINEAWFQDKFDAMQNYPNDFSNEYFEQFFDEKINKNEFTKWVEKFKNQYKNLGAQVD